MNSREKQMASAFVGLVVANDKLDDAAVFHLNQEQAILATVDFFTPIVDDPEDFGRIAACNALSDIYAMGGTPVFALNITGFPIKAQGEKNALNALSRIFAGGAEICRQAGISIAGGHSIDTAEPIYGLAVIGNAHPDQIKRNDGARAGNDIILSKPLGIGLLAAGIQQGKVGKEAYRELLYWTTRLNKIGTELAIMEGVAAMTDVSGFGLVGHLSEMCQASKMKAVIDMKEIPLIKASCQFAQVGLRTGAIKRNTNAYQDCVVFADTVAPWQQDLLLDAQTSGGLLLACEPSQTPQLLTLFHQAGFTSASKIGFIDRTLSEKEMPMIVVR